MPDGAGNLNELPGENCADMSIELNMNPIIIPSGSFRVNKSNHEALIAHLGTCVGVSIVDRQAGVGGLYHILLPETLSGIDDPSDDTYARSGMPKFLSTLIESGCRPHHMEATLAGGALIGNISNLDLSLDVGGRILEIVHGLLTEASIRIINSECGGCYGRKLVLNCRTLDCSIEPSFPAAQGKVAPIRHPNARELERTIAQIKPIPQVVLTIMRMIHSKDYNSKDIAKEVQKDQVLSARVINICNSTFVSPRQEIRSVNQALVMLGERFIAQIILSLYLSNFLNGYNQGYSMAMGGLYHHSISAAVVGERIARLTNKTDPDIAYLAGLTHDIGKVVLDQYVAPALPHFYRMIYQDGMDLLTAEKSILGITHTEVGGRLAELWALPPYLLDTIAYHSRPENARCDKILTYTIYLANLLNVRFCVGSALESIGVEDLSACLSHLGINMTRLNRLISQFSGEQGIQAEDSALQF
ncbi:MAG: HDOD domain-containing protein [Acidobacteria bacterium]|nr:HDOD domain-containing protein [Acidobacteriota bacterium]